MFWLQWSLSADSIAWSFWTWTQYGRCFSHSEESLPPHDLILFGDFNHGFSRRRLSFALCIWRTVIVHFFVDGLTALSNQRCLFLVDGLRFTARSKGRVNAWGRHRVSVNTWDATFLTSVVKELTIWIPLILGFLFVPAHKEIKGFEVTWWRLFQHLLAFELFQMRVLIDNQLWPARFFNAFDWRHFNERLSSLERLF